MIYLLYGPDTYRSRAKLNEIIAAFQAKAGGAFGGIGLRRIDAADEPEAVLSIGQAGSLFSAKELFVVEYLTSAPPAVSEYVLKRLSAWARDPALTVIFREGEVSGKPGTSLIARLERAAAKTQEFKPLPASAVGRWLDAEGARRKMRLSVEDKRTLIAAHGSNLWALSGELDKMAHGWSLELAARADTSVWDFTDTFLQTRRASFDKLSRLLDAGEEPIKITGALGFALRRAASSGRGSHAAPDGLRARFADTLTADIETKTGRLPPPLPLVKLVLKR